MEGTWRLEQLDDFRACLECGEPTRACWTYRRSGRLLVVLCADCREEIVTEHRGAS
jgi:hypothetical protein